MKFDTAEAQRLVKGLIDAGLVKHPKPKLTAVELAIRDEHNADRHAQKMRDIRARRMQPYPHACAVIPLHILRQFEKIGPYERMCIEAVCINDIGSQASSTPLTIQKAAKLMEMSESAAQSGLERLLKRGWIIADTIDPTGYRLKTLPATPSPRNEMTNENHPAKPRNNPTQQTQTART